MIERVIDPVYSPAPPTADDRLATRLRSGLAALASRLTATDRAALGYWVAAHLALVVVAYASSWVLARDNPHMPLTGGYERWDATLLRSIAQYGYWGGPAGKLAHPNQVAFFPGYPLVLAAVHGMVRNWVLAELLLSFTAGAVAMVALARLAGSSRAALYLVTAPAAIFLTIGYSESLYLAFAVPAWLAARRGGWGVAGGLAYFAAFTRPDGLFLVPALAVMALTRPVGARWRALGGVALGGLAPVVYEVFLRFETGSWSAWSDANRDGWGLGYVGPWQSLKASYWGAFQHPYSAEFAFMEQLEIAGIGVALAATVVYLGRRRWPEAVYCGLAVAALGTSTWYQSVPRTVLVLFPLWVSLAQAARRRPLIGSTYVAVCGPLAVLLGALYLGGAWAG